MEDAAFSVGDANCRSVSQADSVERNGGEGAPERRCEGGECWRQAAQLVG